MTVTTSPTERVGRYQLLEPSGIGPTGTVSRAKVFGVAGFERQFAVKRFHTELTATAAMAAMLSAAARAYGSLEHPRIARMSEFGVAQGATFTAVEYVVGLDALRLIGEARLAGVSLAAGGALALVSQAARAVGYAHGRGLTHLGLAPTNVIITADGDIKITDFGILSATLSQRPIEVPRLAQRIPYLAPEQLANEATSAATDVFALGVLAYELVTATRTFKGDTPQQVASAIMAGPPPEPALPRPIVRVLQRCLARSPFERFPDARALADALDAALRVAPVPGTRKDVGAQVKETLDRLAALNEGQMSGVVALHLGTGPIRRYDEDRSRAPTRSGGDLGASEPPAYALGRPDTASDVAPAQATGPSGAAGPGGTLQDLSRGPVMTVPGLAPPPIPIPPGVAELPIPPLPGQPGASTLVGLGKATATAPPAIPPVRSKSGSGAGIPLIRPPAVPTPAQRPPGPPAAVAAVRPEIDPAIAIEPASPGARIDAANDGPIHTLDPSDLLSVDERGEPYADDAPDEAGGPSPPGRHEEPAAASAIPTAPADPRDSRGNARRREPAEPGTLGDGNGSRASAAQSSATRNLRAARDPRESPSRAGVPSGLASAARSAPHAAYPPDPSTVDTRPMEPVVLEPALFDPIVRANAVDDGDAAVLPDVPEVHHAPETLEPDRRVDQDSRAKAPPPSTTQPTDAAEAADAADAADVDAVETVGFDSETADPRTGQTMLGYASPRPPAPPVYPPGSPSDSPGGPPADESSADPAATWSLETAAPGHETAQPPVEGWAAAPPAEVTAVGKHPPPRIAWILVGILGAAVVAIGAWQVYLRASTSAEPRNGSATSVATGTKPGAAIPPGDVPQVATAPAPDAAPTALAPLADAASVATTSGDAAPAASAPGDAPRAPVLPADAARVAAARGDAGATAAAPDEGPLAKKPLAPIAAGDTLSIDSTPPGARVFIDGSDTGATPLKLPGSPDRHSIALLLAGHELYLAQVDGHGTFQVPLKEVTPTNGPAGIKVLRCKDKDRYYVFVDGKPTGQTCPTERIGCEVGAHTVEVYDVVSETRRKWDIVVKDTRLSFRIRVE